MQEPTFFIGNIPVYGDRILAPMDGITSHPFRLFTRRLGSSVSYTEFIGAVDMIHGRTHLKNHLYFSEEERPLGYQIIDNDPERILQAARIMEQRRPDFIDINMGCPAKDVSGRGAGAGLLRYPEKIKVIFKSLVQQIALPITAKIRLGWDDGSINYIDIVKLLEDCGVSAIAVHGRTRQQSFNGAANWDAIAEVKARASVPVIGNGDVKTVDDIARMKAHTGCDAVMIGRASLSNPWIFSARDRDQISPDDLFAGIHQHLSLMLDFYGQPGGLILFRKHLVQYLRPYAVPQDLRQAMLTCEDPAVFAAYLDETQSLLEPVSPN